MRQTYIALVAEAPEAAADFHIQYSILVLVVSSSFLHYETPPARYVLLLVYNYLTISIIITYVQQA